MPGTYTLSASVAGLSFWPKAQSIVLSSNVTQNFTEWTCGVDAPLYLQGEPSTPMTLPNHPAWWQDPYASANVGDLQNTLGRWGCNLSSQAMIVSYYGRQSSSPIETNPGTLNTWMKSNEGYTSEDGVIYSRVMRFARSNHVNLFLRAIEGPNDTKLSQHLCNGDLAMLQVLNGGHYVLATGKTTINSVVTYTINDPIMGQTTLAQSYPGGYQEALYYTLGLPASGPFGLEFHALSPIQLLLTDSLGRRVGYDPRTGTAFNEIPEAGYLTGAIRSPDGTTLPEEKIVFVPQPSTLSYNVQAIGTGSGPYTIETFLTDSSGNTKVTTQSGTALPNSVNTYVINTVNYLFLPLITR